MQQSLMTLRVRPARLAVLIDRSSKATELAGVFRFLSQLWGGRFGTIIPVDASTPDPLTAFRLGALRPEFVYGVGLESGKWDQAVYDACQQRWFSALSPKVMQDVRGAYREGFIRGDRAVIAMFNARNERSQYKRDLVVVNADIANVLAIYCAAMFGVHHSNLAPEYLDEARKLNADVAEEFINLCTDLARNRRQTWLDANSYGLSTFGINNSEVEPTIVLVRDTVRDLSLFWNLRMVSDYNNAPWILPVPADQVARKEVTEAIGRWLDAFDPIANYCVVTSETVTKEDCATFIDDLKESLAATSFKYVDYSPSMNRLPVVVPFESESIWPVSIEGRTIEFVPPSPKCFDVSGGSECWHVDLVNDAATQRAPMEMQLPPSTAIPEILNGPCPPKFEHAAILRFGDGADSVNVRCSSQKSVIRFYVPSPKEVLGELIREGGYEAVHDEKRSGYTPTIERFGSIYDAASAFSGKSAEILEVLQKRGPLLSNQIRGHCQLGGSDLPIDNYLGRIENTLQLLSERTKRISMRRFSEYAQGDIPDSLSLGALLEHWADRAVVKRSWELGPCSHCAQTWFNDQLDIQKPVICPNCGQRMRVPERVPIGYSLAPTVKHSFEQGIVPVVLAGRFLRNLSHRGFFWLPGMKYRVGGDYGDIDLIACCDGNLVLAECKRLTGIPAEALVWQEVLDQFFALSKVAMDCNAGLVVLAAQVATYPEYVLIEIDKRLKSKIPYLILDGKDLEDGHRKNDQGRWLSISDFMPVDFPESLVAREGGPRQIKFGAMTYTKGG